MAKLAADVGFINLNRCPLVSELQISGLPHAFADPVGHIPGSLISHVDMALKLVGRYAFLGVAHQRYGRKPLAQWQMGIMKQGTGQRAELKPAGGALKQPTRSTGLVLRFDRPALDGDCRPRTVPRSANVSGSDVQVRASRWGTCEQGNTD